MLPVLYNINNPKYNLYENFEQKNSNIRSLNEYFLDGYIDYRKWKISKPTKSLYTLNSGYLAISHTPSIYISDFEIISMNYFIGNFSIELDFQDIAGFNTLNSKILSIIVESVEDPSNYYFEFGKRKNLNTEYFCNFKNNSALESSTKTDTNTSGKLRICRSDSSLRFYAKTINDWVLITEKNLAGFKDLLQFKIISNCLNSGTGSIKLNSIKINNKTNSTNDYFSNSGLLNLDMWDYSTESLNSSIKISGGRLYSISKLNSNIINSKFGVLSEDFETNVVINNITGAGAGALLASFGCYNRYSNIQNGLKIEYIAAANPINNSIVFSKIENNIASIINSITLNTSNIAFKIKRMGNNFEGFYKLETDFDFTSLGTFISTQMNEFKHAILKTTKSVSGTDIENYINNFTFSADKVYFETNENRISKTAKIKHEIFQEVTSNLSGISYIDGMQISINNNINSEYSIKSNFLLRGNFQIELSLAQIELPLNSASFLEIKLIPKINNNNKEATLRFSKSNNFTNTSSNIFYFSTKTIDTSTSTQYLEFNKNSALIRITRNKLSNILYEYSLDGITWNNICPLESFNDEEDMLLNISLKNSKTEDKGSSINLKHFNINYADELIWNNSICFCDYRVEKNYAQNLNHPTLVNFNKPCLLNNFGIFKKSYYTNAAEDIIYQAKIFYNEMWEYISNNNSTLNFANTYARINYTGVSNYLFKSRFISTIPQDAFFDFSCQGVKTNNLIGLVFFKIDLYTETGTMYSVSLNSINTTYKQQLKIEIYKNWNFISPESTQNVLLDFQNSSDVGTIRIRFQKTDTGTLNIQYSLFDSMPENVNYIDAISPKFTINNWDEKCYYNVSYSNTTAQTGYLEFQAFQNKETFLEYRNKSVWINTESSNYLTIPKSLISYKDEYSICLSFRTLKDTTGIRTIYAENSLSESLFYIQKNASRFYVYIKNHLGNYIALQSQIYSDFNNPKEWQLILTFSRENGYRLYINGILQNSLNDGSTSPLVYSVSSNTIGKDISSNFFLGTIYQVALIEKELTEDFINSNYSLTKNLLQKNLYSKGVYI